MDDGKDQPVHKAKDQGAIPKKRPTQLPCSSDHEETFSRHLAVGAAWPSSCKASDLRLKKRPTRPPRRSDHKETFSGQLAVAVLCEEDVTFNKQQAPVSPSCLPWNLAPLERNLESEGSSLNHNQGAARPSSCKAYDLGLKEIRPTRPPRRSDHKETFSAQLAVAVLCEEDDTFNKQQAPVSPSCLPWNLSPLERNVKSEDSSVNHNQGAAWPSSCKASDLRLKKGPTRPPHQSDHKETFSGQLAVAVLCEEDAIYNKQQAPVSSSCLPWNLSPLERNLKSEDSSVNCNQGAAWPSIYKAEDHGSKKRPTRPPRRSDHKETFSRQLAVAVLCKEDDTFSAQQVPVSPTCFPWNLSPLERNLKSGDSSVNHNCNQVPTVCSEWSACMESDPSACNKQQISVDIVTPSNREYPPLRPPPPESNLKSEDITGNCKQGFDNESSTTVATASVEESDHSSAQNTMTNKLVPANNQLSDSSFLKVTETYNQNETSQIENIRQFCPTASDTNRSDIPPRPPTPEEGGHSSLVTGCQSPRTSEACGGSSKNPAEHSDVIGNDGLLQDLTKEIERLHFNETYLVQELRLKSTKCVHLQAEVNEAKQLFEETRAECALVQEEKRELTQRFNESVSLGTEQREMIRMLQEMLLWKSQECDRLRERVPPHIPEEED